MKQHFLGSMTPADFGAFFILAVFGALFMMLIQTTGRNLNSLATPTRFSWSFFIEDNWKRFLAGVMLILIGIRFSQFISGFEMNAFYSLSLGMGLDRFAQLLKDKTAAFGQKKES